MQLLLLLLLGTVVGRGASSVNNLKIEGYDQLTGSKIRICDRNDDLMSFNTALQDISNGSSCSYVAYSCHNIGQRSQVTVKSCSVGLASPYHFNGTNASYTATDTKDEVVECQGALEWNENELLCGCKLRDYSSAGIEYKSRGVGDIVETDQEIKLRCTDGKRFGDYNSETSVKCGPDTDLANYLCQTLEELKRFNNKVAHFEGTLESYVIIDKPFEQELQELGLCFWLRTNDKVGSIFSLANEDHWNALRFDTHTSHIHFTMAGLHTDHGLVPGIALVDTDWRYFCANWRSSDGNATVMLRKRGESEVVVHTGILPLSVGKAVRATGGKLALGNLWKEDVTEMSFNSIGSFEGDVMGLTLFNKTVELDDFNRMFDQCSTIIDERNVVLSWDGLLSEENDVRVSATFGHQVCSQGHAYAEEVLKFPYDPKYTVLSNHQQNYAKIENAFSMSLTEFTICTMLKSEILIGTIFSYVTTDVNGFSEEIVLEKHKTHMHFYMAGVDQQVGAVPKISISTDRWYTTCFTWEDTGRWRGYLDGDEVTTPDTGLLEETIGRQIEGGGTCYLGILKSFNSFREYRGYGGEITELNLWGKALTPQQIKHMAQRSQVYEEDLLVNWGTLLDNKRGDMDSLANPHCSGPDAVVGNGYFEKSDGEQVDSVLYLPGDVVRYYCEGATTLAPSNYSFKNCTADYVWEPPGEVFCQGCAEAGLEECPGEKCLKKSQLCDGNKDCADASDEANCPNTGGNYIIIGVLLAIILVLVPAFFAAKKARTIYQEKERVKRLLDQWEVKREHLKLEDVLGAGAFGKVYRGLLFVPDSGKHLTVAVKEPSDAATEGDRNLFLEEIRLSKKLGNHPNIVGIVGSIIVYEPCCLILEFVDGGDLLGYLQKNRESASVSQEDQVFFAWQIANGMEYVSKMNFVHRDLAARNVLISSEKRCKITDFGLARDLYNYDVYQSEGGKVPIKWMSPEAIFELKFTTESDVWAYAVTLYEIFSMGGSPYPGMEDLTQLRHRLWEGFRMAAPDNTPQFIYDDIMLLCWNLKPSDRPSFEEIRKYIQKMIDLYQADYVPFKRFMDDNMEGGEGGGGGGGGGEAGPSAAPSDPDQGYTNVTFAGSSSLSYKAPVQGATTAPAGNSSSKIPYTEIIVPEHDTPDTPQAATVMKIDEDGIAEIGRGEYMNMS